MQAAPAALVLGSLVALAEVQGAYFPQAWHPLALGLLLLLVATAAGAGRALPHSTAARVAVLAFAGLVAWSLVSILWAPSQGGARETGEKLLLYLLAMWSVSLVRLTECRTLAVLGAWSFGSAAILAASLLSATASDAPAAFFAESRYANPIGYSNAVAAFAVVAAWPALALSARRETPVVLRAAWLATAVFLVEMSLLTQSRGSLLALCLAAPALVATAPRRGAALVSLLVVAAGAALAAGPILEVYDAENPENIGPLLNAAARAIALTAAGTFVLGALAAVAAARVTVPPHPLRVRRRALIGLAGAACVAASALALLNATGIATAVERRWEAFSSEEVIDPGGGPRILGVGSDQRYDLWRVSLSMFAADPLAGAGAGAFELRYTAERRRPRHSRYAHSFWARLLGESGAVGMLLFCTFVGAIVVGGVRARKRLGVRGRTALAGALASFVCLLAQASVDWVDEVPSVAAAALAVPLLALAQVPPDAARRSSWGTGRRAAVWAIPLALAAGLLLSGSYLSVLYTERAFERWRTDPAGAYEDLRRARTADPLAVRPHIAEGAVALASGDADRARSAFARAASAEPSWYAHLQLAAIAAERRRFPAARRELERAATLNPPDPAVEDLGRLIERRVRVDPVRFNRRMARQALARIGFSR